MAYRLPLILMLLIAASLGLAQTPTSVLAAQIKKETGIQFTYKAKHQKTTARYGVVVLHLTPKDKNMDQARALGLMEKKNGKWTVIDYVVGTSHEDSIATMQKAHKKVPKSLYPKKV